MKQVTKRLKPGDDLKESIENLVKENNIQAGIIQSVVGGVSQATLRMGDGKTVNTWEEVLEIVSGTGTVSQTKCHIHISLSKMDGSVIGGHLKPGCTVKETAEIVLLVFDDVKYGREPDEETGYDELTVN